jgi:hypothetical protein
MRQCYSSSSTFVFYWCKLDRGPVVVGSSLDFRRIATHYGTADDTTNGYLQVRPSAIDGGELSTFGGSPFNSKKLKEESAGMHNYLILNGRRRDILWFESTNTFEKVTHPSFHHHDASVIVVTHYYTRYGHRRKNFRLSTLRLHCVICLFAVL